MKLRRILSTKLMALTLVAAMGFSCTAMAEEEGTVIGFSHVMILKQKEVACLRPQTVVYIQDLDVMESERSRGIGTLLMNASKEYGKKYGADFIRTQVFPQNTAGIRFYERNGFREMMKTIECQF